MDEQQHEQLKQLISAAENNNKEAINTIYEIIQQQPQAINAIAQVAQEIPAEKVLGMLQQMSDQQAQAYRIGGIINYVKFLRGKCPEGYTMQTYFKNGGKCKQCTPNPQAEQRNNKQEDAVTAFKCGRKMKKVVKDQKPAGPLKRDLKKKEIPAEEVYADGEYLDMPFDGQEIVSKQNGPSFFFTPDVISKGYDYDRGDSIAFEMPRQFDPQLSFFGIPYSRRLTEPTHYYKKEDPENFIRVRNRFDKAASVTNNPPRR